MRKQDVKDALEQRASIKVDPFGAGFDHAYDKNHSFVLNKFRLAIQVFLKPEGDQGPAAQDLAKFFKSDSELGKERRAAVEEKTAATAHCCQ